MEQINYIQQVRDDEVARCESELIRELEKLHSGRRPAPGPSLREKALRSRLRAAYAAAGTPTEERWFRE